jgi:DNA invertase Pin-like site-specific DNA recombinase
MQYIYSRVSTDKQDNSNQLEHLKTLYPDAVVFEETVSGANTNKPVLESLLNQLEPGDILIVSALDRLGRKLLAALTLIEGLYSRGVKVISVREGLDYTTISGKFVSQIMMSVAEMERNLIANRIKQALAAKKLEAKRTNNGWKCGRPNTIPSSTVAQVLQYRQDGMTIRQISSLTGVSTGRICQLLKAVA